MILFQGYLNYIKSLPINDTPEIFGLHDNANITFAQNETFQLLSGLVKLQPKTASGGGRSREEVINSQFEEILRKFSPTPSSIIISALSKKSKKILYYCSPSCSTCYISSKAWRFVMGPPSSYI
jgi:hypothetical protein